MTADRFKLGGKVLRNLAGRGPAGADWLANLPALVAGLERRWNIAAGAVFPTATEAYAAPAVAADGEPVVLKISIPGVEKAEREIAVLQAAQGNGFVRLLRHDPESGAVLLERLGPQLAEADLAIAAYLEILCTTLRHAWAMPAQGLKLLTGAQKARKLAADIERVTAKIPDACSPHTAAIGLRFAHERAAAFDPATSVLGHGDAHIWNTLSDPKTGDYKFVDPEGNFIERAHDLSISLREWPGDFLAGDPLARGRERCALLARLSGVEAHAIWQWGLIEQLVNGLLYTENGSDNDAAPFLAVAEAWARAEPA
jgi:streptomycin 6-kinase